MSLRGLDGREQREQIRRSMHFVMESLSNYKSAKNTLVNQKLDKFTIIG